MCDTVAGRLLLLCDRSLEARYTLVGDEYADIVVEASLDQRLTDLDLHADHLPFELLRLRVPEGSEAWAAGRLQERFRSLAAGRRGAPHTP